MFLSFKIDPLKDNFHNFVFVLTKLKQFDSMDRYHVVVYFLKSKIIGLFISIRDHHGLGKEDAHRGVGCQCAMGGEVLCEEEMSRAYGHRYPGNNTVSKRRRA